jgi:hypothetical protein
MPEMNMNYGFDMAPARAGQLADASLARTDSFIAQSIVLPGRGVVRGTDVSEVKAPGAATDKFAGIVRDTRAKESDYDNGGLSYKKAETVPVLTFGRIWAEAVGTIGAGDPAKLIVSGDDAGKFAAGVASGVTAIAVPGAAFTGITFNLGGDDGLAVVELR